MRAMLARYSVFWAEYPEVREAWRGGDWSVVFQTFRPCAANDFAYRTLCQIAKNCAKIDTVFTS